MLPKLVLGSLLGVSLPTIPACKSTDGGKPEALTGQVEREGRGTPRFEAHGKGGQWGRIVYDRDRDH